MRTCCALLFYRAIYNLIPFALSAVALALIGSQRGKSLSSTAGTG